jgi:hypothetical protein
VETAKLDALAAAAQAVVKSGQKDVFPAQLTLRKIKAATSTGTRPRLPVPCPRPVNLCPLKDSFSNRQ